MIDPAVKDPFHDTDHDDPFDRNQDFMGPLTRKTKIPVAESLSFEGNAPPSGLTSNGDEVLYDVEGDTLTAYAVDHSGLVLREVFRLEAAPDSGVCTFTLYDRIDTFRSSEAGSQLDFAMVGTEGSDAQVIGTLYAQSSDRDDDFSLSVYFPPPGSRSD